jgi:hypothetical protein
MPCSPFRTSFALRWLIVIAREASRNVNSLSKCCKGTIIEGALSVAQLAGFFKDTTCLDADNSQCEKLSFYKFGRTQASHRAWLRHRCKPNAAPFLLYTAITKMTRACLLGLQKPSADSHMSFGCPLSPLERAFAQLPLRRSAADSIIVQSLVLPRLR